MYFPENMTAQYFFFDTYPGQFLQVLPVALLAGLLCYVLQGRRGSVPRSLRAWRAVFACYLAGLLAVTVVPMGVWGSLWYRLLYGMPSGAQVDLFTFSYNFALDLTDFDGEKAINLLLFVPSPFCIPCPAAVPDGGGRWRPALWRCWRWSCSSRCSAALSMSMTLC